MDIIKLKQTICLNMIVKNEAHIIIDTLEKLLLKIKFDYYVICDTGSTDTTVSLIKTFFNNKKINGDIIIHTWKDFGYNRTLALECAFGKSDYVLIFDADDSIEGTFTLPVLTFDSYMLKFGNQSNAYERMCLVKNNIVWKYLGVLHEYITCDQKISKGSISGEYYIISGRTSSRNNDPDKYLNDARILEEGYYTAIKNNDNLSHRYVYYCANSYCDAGDFENAIKWYKLTLSANGWFDERYNSCLKLFELTGDKEFLVESFRHNSRRVEGIYNLIKHYCCENKNEIAMNYYLWIKNYFENEVDDLSTKLFARTLDYTFYLPYYMIIVSEKVKDHNTGIKMYIIIFSKMEDTLLAGEWWINNLLFNLQFFNEYFTTPFIEKIKIFFQFLIKNNIKFNVPPVLEKFNINKTILFYTGFSDILWNNSYSEKHALGGSERAVLNLAKKLSKKYKIIIVGDLLEEVVGGISFVHRFNFENKELHFNIIIVSRYVSFFTIFPKFTADKLILMAHDTHFMNNLTGCSKSTEEIIENIKIDCCVCLTQWQVDEYRKHYPKLKYSIINNGIDTTLFPQNLTKIKSSFIYTSGSIRGLKRLLELWPEITKLLPDAILNIASYEDFPKNDFDRELEVIINSFSNVFHFGKLNHKKLYHIIAKSEFWLYPCSFRETSCITAMEMMMAGVICLYYPIAGLTDTMNGHGIKIYEGTEIETLKNLCYSTELAKEYALSCSWESRAKEWESLLNEEVNSTKIKVINLKRREDRKLDMQIGLKGLSYDFIEAIDGLSLGSSKEIQELFKNNDHNYHKGVIGCALSHIKVWKELEYDPQNEYYIVLEDDLIFSSDFKNKLDRVTSLFCENNLEFLSIGSFDIHIENELIEKLDVIKQENIIWTGGTHGYIISKSGCQKILKNIERYSLNKSIDFEIVQKKSFDIYFLNESIVKQKSFEDTDIQRHSECFYFANKLPKKVVFLYLPDFNILALTGYLNSLPFDVIITSKMDDVKYIDEVVFIHELPLTFDLQCTISYLNTEPLNLSCRLNYIIYNVFPEYPQIKTYYDYSLANIQILNGYGIKNTFHLEYPYNPTEVEFLKEQRFKLPKLYDFGIMCSGSKPTKDPMLLTPIRRREVVKYLLDQNFTVNIISGWGKDRDTELAQCKTILNIHGQYVDEPCTIFEHIRCNRLLYAGYPILSERSLNCANYPTLKFIPYESFFKLTKRSKVIDCFIFYNEVEMLDYRINLLKDIVDYFVIVEATLTFTGKPKEMYFDSKKYPNVIHIIVDDLPFKNAKDYEQWENETYQRNCIDRGLKQIALQPDDFIIISDVDEIPDPCSLNLIKMESNLEVLSQFEQDFYYYNLNNKLTDLWYSSKIFKYKLLTKSIQEIRLEVFYGIYPGGWHLSYFGTPERISNKIQNFGHQEFNTIEFTDCLKIKHRVSNGIDIFDRPIKINKIPYHLNGYLPPNSNKYFSTITPMYCFIHSCNTDGDLYRLNHLLNTLSKSNIHFEKIFINNVGLPLPSLPGVEVTQYSENIGCYEIPTINKIRDFSNGVNANILYLHTKGTGHPKDSKVINDWIDMMLYYLVEMYPVALHELENVDTVGCNYHTYDSCRAPPHFSGNFWWAKSNYLAGLPDCGKNKFDAEFWLHIGNPKFKCLHDTGGMNHYFNEYPSVNYRI